MVTSHTNTCDRCKRVNPIAFGIEPPEAWRSVVLNRWKKPCPSCFDTLAEQAGLAYRFVDLEDQSWSEIPRHAAAGKEDDAPRSVDAPHSLWTLQASLHTCPELA